jgi:hypothetical protein
MIRKIRGQILAIRDTGTNMLDVVEVQRLAHDRQMWELVQYIEECEKDYIAFIRRGQL